jgi:hypothetical protein
MIFYFVRITQYVLLLGAHFVLCVTQPPQSSFNLRLPRCCITIATDHVTSHNRYISKWCHVCIFERNLLLACDVSFHSHTPRIQSKPKTLSCQKISWNSCLKTQKYKKSLRTTTVIHNVRFEVRGSHNSVDKDTSLLGCYDTATCKELPAYWRNILSSIPRRGLAPEDQGSMLLQNVDIYQLTWHNSADDMNLQCYTSFNYSVSSRSSHLCYIIWAEVYIYMCVCVCMCVYIYIYSSFFLPVMKLTVT